MLNRAVQFSRAAAESPVAWRCATAPAAVTYAMFVRDLGMSAAISGKKEKHRPASAVFAIMASLRGDWRRADLRTREALASAYHHLKLRNAAAALRRLDGEPPRDTGHEELEDAVAAYLAPPEAIYELDEDFNHGLDCVKAEDWPQALSWLTKAFQGYRQAGGLHELHAADCLLNMSVAAIRLDKADKALAWASAAQQSYERWARLPHAAKAALNRIGILHCLGRDSHAAHLAKDCLAISLRTGIRTLAVDSLCVELALQSRLRPQRQLLEEIGRLERHFGDGCDPQRRSAYQCCRQLAQSALDKSVAKQSLRLILEQAIAHGVPDGFEPLKKLLQHCPEAVSALTDRSFLELPSRAWPVLREAAAGVSSWLKSGVIKIGEGEQTKLVGQAVERLSRAIGFWQAPQPAAAGRADACRPTELLSPKPRVLSLDAATRLLEVHPGWQAGCRDHPEELAALGALCLCAVVPMVEVGRDAAAKQLLRAGRNCRPDADEFMLDYVARRESKGSEKIIELCSGTAKVAVFPEREEGMPRISTSAVLNKSEGFPQCDKQGSAGKMIKP